MAKVIAVENTGHMVNHDTDFIRSLVRSNDTNISPLLPSFGTNHFQRLMLDPNDPVLKGMIFENMNYVIGPSVPGLDRGVYFTTASFVNQKINYEFEAHLLIYLDISNREADSLTLGNILRSQRGNCFEMALTTHVLLASLGIKSAVVNGTVKTVEGPEGGHVWVEARDITTGQLIIVEPTAKGAYVLSADAMYAGESSQIHTYVPVRRTVAVIPIKELRRGAAVKSLSEI